MTTRVGFVGTGAMGTCMAGRLLDQRHDVVVHNRTRHNAAPVEAAGARWADSPGEVALAADIVVSCLRDTAAVASVYQGPAGLLAHARRGQVFVEHGTFAPDLARELSEHAHRKGAAFLDVPVSGGPDGAQQGRLVAMAGGDADAMERASTVLGAYCAHVVRVGPSGTGLQLKLVNQLVVSVHMAVAAEAISLLEVLGLDLAVAESVLSLGWARSAMLERSLRQTMEQNLTGTGATIGGMREVQTLVGALVDRSGLPTPVFMASRRTFESAVIAGAGTDDPAALARLAAPIRSVRRGDG